MQTHHWFLPTNWKPTTWRSLHDYITIETFEDPMGKKYRMVKLNYGGNRIARIALSMFDEHYTDKTFVNIMTCDIVHMDEIDEEFVSAEAFASAIKKIFPLASVSVVGPLVSATIHSPMEQFGEFSTLNGCYEDTSALSREEDYVWRSFAKLLKILRDNPIVEVKVRVKSCPP